MSKAAVLLLLALLAAPACWAQAPSDDCEDQDLGRAKRPWFCHGRDCPCFKTVDEQPDYSLRCYGRSTWAVSCVRDAFMPDAVLLANARVMQFVKDNDLWGGTPFANVIHVGVDNQAAWENATSPIFGSSAGEVAPDAGEAGGVEGALKGCVHKTVCAAYFLPYKYQYSASRTEVDRPPPRPSKDSHVHIYRAPRFEAYVSGFAGFPTPPRFIFESMRLANSLKWHGENFKWGNALFYVYDPPTATTGRWNEVLLPAGGYHDTLFFQGDDVFEDSQAAVA